jgi:hypothetical protein
MTCRGLVGSGKKCWTLVLVWKPSLGRVWLPIHLVLSELASHSAVFFSHNKSTSARISLPETIQQTGPGSFLPLWEVSVLFRTLRELVRF